MNPEITDTITETQTIAAVIARARGAIIEFDFPEQSDVLAVCDWLERSRRERDALRAHIDKTAAVLAEAAAHVRQVIAERDALEDSETKLLSANEKMEAELHALRAKLLPLKRLVRRFLVMAEERDAEASRQWNSGNGRASIALENAAAAYERCARELERVNEGENPPEAGADWPEALANP